ncbi:MAG: hypothetical protein KME54_27600 [Tolypothrix brevis GSE-NOS-MK-07-07A]|jgi:hypothetical protein|nr:hypothetical protein [Tolypothrix brevis GSE-NOS-MK-07-07A]
MSNMPLFSNSSRQEIITGEKGDTGATGAKGEKGDTGSTAPGAWQNLTLATNWSNYATGYTTPQCRKLIGNLIEVKGMIKKSSALVANEIITTLPSGYRPTEIMLITTWASGGTSRLQIEPSGAIKLASGNNGGVSLSFLFGLN